MGICASYNVYQDAVALRGSLELSAQFFDSIFVIHSGPGGAYSTDGTIELLESFGIKPVFADMNVGFGVIRSRLIRECGEEWAFILDSDERFYPVLPLMRCEGTDKYPDVAEPALHVQSDPNTLIAQGHYLRRLIQDPEIDVVKSIRRHWFDFSMTRPTQNWELIKDWQMRIVRNTDRVGFLGDVRMHEQMKEIATGREPRHHTAGVVEGPWHEHYHCFFRRTQLGHKEFNEANYSRLDRGEPMVSR